MEHQPREVWCLLWKEEKPKRMRGFTALSQSQFLTPNLGKLGWFCFVPVVPALSSALSSHLGQKNVSQREQLSRIIP